MRRRPEPGEGATATAHPRLGVSCAPAEGSGTRDAPIDVRLRENSAPFVANTPNGFMNVAIRCVGANAIYAPAQPAAPVAIVDDPL